jgi:RNase P protein component
MRGKSRAIILLISNQPQLGITAGKPNNEALKFHRLKRRTRSLLQELFLSYSSVRG